jgi:hypothetical protein
MRVRAILPLSAIYAWPLFVAALTAAGLAAALLGEGATRVFSWFALSFPMVLSAACLLSALIRRKKHQAQCKLGVDASS